MGLTESEARQAIIDETKQDIVIAIRMKRAPLIAEADIMINTAIDRNEDVAALRAYRQALRDVPQHYLATGKVEFPDKP
ncbi:hypothetical protein JC606_17935 [Vibrio sp. IB15]|nr:hypothetical protein [Vibrio sp. IB15]PMI81749.1 hypothetical protein BCU36_11715 [Vibrio lentus]